MPNRKSGNEVRRTRKCGCMEMHNRLLEAHPSFRSRLVKLEHACSARLRTAPVVRNTPYLLPVVVHIVDKQGGMGISDAQVKSQIQVLNTDFRLRNADKSEIPAPWAGLAADAMVEFHLAKRDPKGANTVGITRTKTKVAAFDIDDEVKYASKGGVDPWPRDAYLNIWVCSLVGGILGYAQFPGGPARTDGVVILNTAFGTQGTAAAPFNLGRTATHEVGHYLNLRHIWGDTEDCSGGDLVADTPNAETPNYGKPSFPHISCGNGPHGDMFVNYMDYVDDEAMFMFTKGQVERMHAALDGPRAKLVAGASAIV